MIELLIVLLIAGAALYLADKLPIDDTIKLIIKVVAVVGICIWLLRNLSVLGVG